MSWHQRERTRERRGLIAPEETELAEVAGAAVGPVAARAGGRREAFETGSSTPGKAAATAATAVVAAARPVAVGPAVAQTVVAAKVVVEVESEVAWVVVDAEAQQVDPAVAPMEVLAAAALVGAAVGGPGCLTAAAARVAPTGAALEVKPVVEVAVMMATVGSGEATAKEAVAAETVANEAAETVVWCSDRSCCAIVLSREPPRLSTFERDRDSRSSGGSCTQKQIAPADTKVRSSCHTPFDHRGLVCTLTRTSNESGTGDANSGHGGSRTDEA